MPYEDDGFYLSKISSKVCDKVQRFLEASEGKPNTYYGHDLELRNVHRVSPTSIKFSLYAGDPYNTQEWLETFIEITLQQDTDTGEYDYSLDLIAPEGVNDDRNPPYYDDDGRYHPGGPFLAINYYKYRINGINYFKYLKLLLAQAAFCLIDHRKSQLGLGLPDAVENLGRVSP